MKHAILITLAIQSFGWGLVACQSQAETDRLARLGIIVIGTKPAVTEAK